MFLHKKCASEWAQSTAGQWSPLKKTSSAESIYMSHVMIHHSSYRIPYIMLDKMIHDIAQLFIIDEWRFD